MEACPPPACHYQHPGEPSQQAPSPSPDIEASGEAEGMQQQLAAGRGAAPACTAAEAATAFGVRCTDGWCAFVRGIWSGSAGLFVPAWIWLWIWPAGFGLDLACWFRPGSSLLVSAWIWPAGFDLDLACWFRPGSGLLVSAWI